MTVNFDASAKFGTASVAGVLTMTIAANACLLVGIATKGNSTNTVSAVAANGNALTRLTRLVNDSTTMTYDIWALTAAPSGAVSISCQVNIAMDFVMGAFTYTGAAGANPFSVIGATTAGTVNNVAVSISTSITDRAVFFGAGDNTLTCMNATVRQVDSAHFGFCWADTAGAADAISLSASALVTGQHLMYAGINITASISVGSRPQIKCLLGCGVA